jgi:hypothetical protein
LIFRRKNTASNSLLSKLRRMAASTGLFRFSDM